MSGTQWLPLMIICMISCNCLSVCVFFFLLLCRDRVHVLSQSHTFSCAAAASLSGRAHPIIITDQLVVSKDPCDHHHHHPRWYHSGEQYFPVSQLLSLGKLRRWRSSEGHFPRQSVSQSCTHNSPSPSLSLITGFSFFLLNQFPPPLFD